MPDLLVQSSGTARAEDIAIAREPGPGKAVFLIDQVTPLIITYNEGPNLRRALEKLTWAKRIVVVDSGSSDETLEIVSAYPQAILIYNAFVDFASQCNFGLQSVSTPWVLSLDADYELSDALVAELQQLTENSAIAGYVAPFVYRIFGRPLRGTLYPPRAVLYRKDKARYRNEGHGHRVQLSGPTTSLRGVIYHDDRKPLSRWFNSQQRYAREEARYLLTSSKSQLSTTDRLRLTRWIAPLLVVPYTLLFKGCILDGWAGWYYALQRLCAEVLIALELADETLRSKRVVKE